MVRRFVLHARILCVLALVWVVLQERLDLLTLLSGIGVAFIAILMTDRLVLRDSYRAQYRVRVLPTLWYGLRLIGAIYVAGFGAVRRMITGSINVGIVEIDSELESGFAVALAASTVTLIPGTVTLDRDGSKLRVIWLDCETKDPQLAAPLILGPFARIIRRITS